MPLKGTLTVLVICPAELGGPEAYGGTGVVSSTLGNPTPLSKDSGPEEVTSTLDVVVKLVETGVERASGGVEYPPREAGDAQSLLLSCFGALALGDCSP